jgi:hypothetical protein
VFAGDVMAQVLAVPGVDFVRSVELFPVSYSAGAFTLDETTQVVPVVSHGVVASHQHDVQIE